MRTFVEEIFSATTNPGTGTTLSAAVDISSVVCLSLQIAFTDSAAAGTIKLQASNDLLTPTRWSDIPTSTAVVAAGALTLLPKIDVSYQWLRASWAATGGAGTMTAKIKTVGY